MSRRITEADALIGSRIKAYRLAAGISQTDLGECVGVSFQQIQKYETGVNRASGGRLLGIAETLSVAPADLLGVGSLEARTPLTFEVMATVDGAKLAAAFAAIKSDAHRNAVIELARSLAEAA